MPTLHFLLQCVDITVRQTETFYNDRGFLKTKYICLEISLFVLFLFIVLYQCNGGHFFFQNALLQMFSFNVSILVNKISECAEALIILSAIFRGYEAMNVTIEIENLYCGSRH